jgi:hypothetical protein
MRVTNPALVPYAMKLEMGRLLDRLRWWMRAA